MGFRETAREVGNWIKGVSCYAAAGIAAGAAAGAAYGSITGVGAAPVALLFGALSGIVCGLGRAFGEDAGFKTAAAFGVGSFLAAVGADTPAPLLMAPLGALVGGCFGYGAASDAVHPARQARVASYKGFGFY